MYLANEEGMARPVPRTVYKRWRGHLDTIPLTFSNGALEIASKDLKNTRYTQTPGHDIACVRILGITLMKAVNLTSRATPMFPLIAGASVYSSSYHEREM